MFAKRLRLTVEVLERRDQPSFASPVMYNIGTSNDGFVPNAAPINVVTADFNKDGKLDLAVSHKSDNSVYMLIGNGDGTFKTAVQVPLGEGIEGREFVGDFNNDGNLDLFLPGASNQAIILPGKGDGTFNARIDSGSFLVSGTYPRGWGVGDFNGDGKLDVASLTPSNSADAGGYVVLPGNGNGTFGTAIAGPMVLHYARWMTTGDFNKDGKLDIATADGQGTSSSTGTAETTILLGNGNGTFTLGNHYASPQLPDPDDANATANPEDIYSFDINKDGNLDLVECDYDNTINVFMGNGNGTFKAARSYNPGHYPRGVQFADVDGDGKIDLVVTNVGINQGASQFAASGVEPGSVAVLRGNGDGTFQAATQYTPFDWPGWTAVGDFNADGAPDLAVSRVYDGHSVAVLLNDPLKTSRFVTNLYADFLNRTPTSGEVSAWSAVYDASGSASVATGIANSHESHLREIRSMYSMYLGRTPGGGEESAWVQQLDQGTTAETLSSRILASAEFANRANILGGTSDSNTNYVRALYQVLLLRSPSQISSSETQAWVNAMAAGANRSDVAMGFLKSQEFRGNAARGYYGATVGATLAWAPNLLKRGTAVSSSEISAWSSSSLDINAMAPYFGGSAEYYAKA